MQPLKRGRIGARAVALATVLVLGARCLRADDAARALLSEGQMPGTRRQVVDWLRCPRFFTKDSGRGELAGRKQGEIAALVRQIAENGGNAFRLSIYWGGEAFFQSRVAPHAPNLRDVDYLREALEEGNRRGIRVVTYMNPNCLYDDHPLHPEVIIRRADGSPWLVGAYGRKHCHYACVNHPKYRKLLLDTIAEIFTRYGPAGLYLDGLTPHTCFCPYCRARYEKMFGRKMPEKFERFGPFCVLWEMTSTPQLIGDPADPDSYRFTRFMARSLHDMTRDVTETVKRIDPEAVVIYHSWPKPSTLRYYDATLNEIYIRRPWHHTLWKDGEFASFGAAMPIPMLHNVYLGHKTECEARHKMVQALAGGVYPNAWHFRGMKPVFEFIKGNDQYFDFNATLPVRHVALVRELRLSSVERKIAEAAVHSIPLHGSECRLRVRERESGGKIDVLCLRSDGRTPSDDEFRKMGNKPTGKVVYLPAESFDPDSSTHESEKARWTTGSGQGALSERWVSSEGGGVKRKPTTALVYRLPPLEPGHPWTLWARVEWPDTGSDSFYWSVSRDGGKTWQNRVGGARLACGWANAAQWTWVRAGIVPFDRVAKPWKSFDRFLSPYVGFYSMLLDARVPMTTLHRRMIEHQLPGYRVLCLAGEVALDKRQLEAIERFVLEGGGLIATGRTSLYDELGQPRGDFGLARLFGARYLGVVPYPASVDDDIAGSARWRLQVTRKHEATGELDGAEIPVVEEIVQVEPAPGAEVLAVVRGEGLPERGLPAVVAHQVGKGRVVYVAARIDSTFSRRLDPVSPKLVGGAVAWACRGRVPCRVTGGDGRVSVRLSEQDGCRIVHLVNQSGDPIEKYDAIPPVKNLTIDLEVPERKRVAHVRALWSKQTLDYKVGEGTVQVRLPRLDEYEVVVVHWE